MKTSVLLKGVGQRFFFRVFEEMLLGVLQQFPDVFTDHLKSHHDGIDIKLA